MHVDPSEHYGSLRRIFIEWICLELYLIPETNCGIVPHKQDVPETDEAGKLKCKKGDDNISFSALDGDQYAKVEQCSTSVNSGESTPKSTKENSVKPPMAPKQDFIHVRARRGQATDSHSLAERVKPFLQIIHGMLASFLSFSIIKMVSHDSSCCSLLYQTRLTHHHVALCIIGQRLSSFMIMFLPFLSLNKIDHINQGVSCHLYHQQGLSCHYHVMVLVYHRYIIPLML